MTTPLNYLETGSYFLNLTEAACGELVAHGNAFFTVSKNLDEDTRLKNFKEKTKWSDNRIGIPVLFNFFHGMEVILKGFLQFNSVKIRNHKLSELLEAFEAHYPGTVIGTIINSYTRNIDPTSPLGQFFQTNNILPNKWYEALKYPELATGLPITHLDLRHGHHHTVGFWEMIGNDAGRLRGESIRLAREIGLDPI